MYMYVLYNLYLHQVKALLDSLEFIFIPFVNPDGYEVFIVEIVIVKTL